ncbi:MAG: formate dehydrogenase accessory protein FdhE [Nitrospirota bacterium]
MEKKSENMIHKVKKRIDDIIKELPSHREVLEFIKDVLIEQYKIKPKIKITPVDIDKVNLKGKNQEGFPLVEKRELQLDNASASRLFKRLCKVLNHNKKAVRDVKQISQALRSKHINLTELFKHAVAEDVEYIIALSKNLKIKEDILSFLIINSIKPIFEAYANELKCYVDQEKWWKGYCPICGSEPFIGESREEGERFLVCSSCSYAWRFMRQKCPFCENENHKELRHFYTEKKGNAYRVDVCEKCKRYVKTVDTHEMGEEVMPIVEDMGTLYLDVLAQKEGYSREKTVSGISINA